MVKKTGIFSPKCGDVTLHMLVCVPENQGGCASGLLKMTQCRLGITKCSRNWTLWCCSPKPTPNSTYFHCSSWHVDLCVLSSWVHSWLAVLCRSWGHSLHAISAAHCSTAAAPPCLPPGPSSRGRVSRCQIGLTKEIPTGLKFSGCSVKFTFQTDVLRLQTLCGVGA